MFRSQWIIFRELEFPYMKLLGSSYLRCDEKVLWQHVVIV